MLLAALILCPGCAGRAAGSAAGRPAPRDGTIIYHEPERAEGLAKRKSPAKTLIFTTGDDAVADDGSFQTSSGPIGEGVDASKVAKQILSQRPTTARVLSREAFAGLWERLARAEIFDLPPHRGKDPPAHLDYFLFDSSAGRMIFTRPEIVGTPRRDDPAWRNLERWRNGKLVLFDTLNER